MKRDIFLTLGPLHFAAGWAGSCVTRAFRREGITEVSLFGLYVNAGRL